MKLIQELVNDCAEKATQNMVFFNSDVAGNPYKHAEIMIAAFKEHLPNHPVYSKCTHPNKNNLELFTAYDIMSLIIMGSIQVGMNIETNDDVSVDVPLMVTNKFLSKFLNFSLAADEIGNIAYNVPQNFHLN